MTVLPSPSFRFDSAQHRYFCEGLERPHITGLLESAGLVDDRWYTEESSIRGQAVHRLTADYDLEALEPETLVSSYRGYVLGHVAAMKLIPHEWDHVEEPRMHPVYLFGGRPDRVGRIYGLQGVLEIKTTAGVDHAHEIQTALQVILAGYGHAVPREQWWRGALYLRPDGKWKLLEHRNRRDFDEADRILAKFCTPARVLPATVPASAGRVAVSDRRRLDREGAAARDRRPAARRVSGTAGV